MPKVCEVDIAQASHPQFVRSVGFVATPGILVVWGSIPFVGQVAVLMAFKWMVLPTNIAVARAIQDVSTLYCSYETGSAKSFMETLNRR